MLSKTRTTIITLVASASFAGASLVPTAAQAQWHNYCVAGHCITHANYTYGDPCANYNKAYEGLLEALQRQKELAVTVNPGEVQGYGGEAEAKAAVEEAEARVHQAEIAAFEYGCNIAAKTSQTSGVVAPGGAISPEVTPTPVQRVSAPSTTLALP
jgi:hypothetical protein